MSGEASRTGTLAPYPGLVSLGTNESGRILVDLEVAHGLIAVRGPRQVVQAALSALAVELVTNRWSDQMRVTLIGFGEGLAEISPERVRVAHTLDDILPDLERRAGQVRDAMASAGIDSVLTGRSQGGDADSWAPHYLIMGVPPTQAQAERLLALARSRYRMGFGYVIAGDVRGATWTWDLSPEGRLSAAVLGFDLEAQLLPPEQYAAVVKLFRGAAAGADVPLAVLSAAAAAPPEHLEPGAVLPVEIGLLGQVAVQAPGPLDPDRLALATELVVYLAAHPDGVHANVLAGAVWPRGVSPEVRDAALSRVHAWLGTDSAGQPNLLTDSDGRLRLGPGARIDWQVFRALFGRASQAAAGSDADAEAGYLEQRAEPGPRPVPGRARRGQVRLAGHRRDRVRGHRRRRRRRPPAGRAAAGRGRPRRRHGGGPGRPAALVQRRAALARPADRRPRHRPGARAARRGRRAVRPGRAGRGHAADGPGNRGAHRRAPPVLEDLSRMRRPLLLATPAAGAVLASTALRRLQLPAAAGVQPGRPGLAPRPRRRWRSRPGLVRS